MQDKLRGIDEEQKELGIELARLEDYKISTPVHLRLWEIPERQDTRHLAHLVEFYDVLPKYVYGKGGLDGKEEYITRSIMYDREAVSLVIAPGLEPQEDGTYKRAYPGRREEIIEEVLRKISLSRSVYMTGNGETLLGMCFSFYEIEEELKNKGHTYSYSQVRAGIELMATTILRISDKSNKFSCISTIIPTLGVDNESKKFFVRFHPLISKSFERKTFRQYDYLISVTSKKILTRWLFRKICYGFRHADENSCYSIKASTICRDSGIGEYKDFRNFLRELEKSLKELNDRHVLDEVKPYEIIKEYGKERKNKIDDALICLYPSRGFIKEMIQYNISSKSIKDNKNPFE